MTEIIVFRRITPRSRRNSLISSCLVMFIAAGITLGFGYNSSCSYYYYYSDYACSSQNTALVITGYFFLALGVLFLILAIALEVQIRKAMNDQSTTVTQPVTIASGYPSQVVTTYPTVSTQYPPPYTPPTGFTSYPVTHSENQFPPTGVTPYTVPPYANQGPPPVGFAAASGPTQQYSKDAVQPPPYAP